MGKGIARIYTTLSLILLSTPIWAQAEGNGSNLLVYGLSAIAVIVFFFFVVQIADNLLAIEAKQLGVDSKKNNISLFPSLGELFAPRLPEFIGESTGNVKVLNKGFDILLEGEADSSKGIEFVGSTFAVQPPNFVGISPIPKVEVEVGAEVKAGDPLFFDKRLPEVKYVAPVSGEVIAVNRGAKRAIASVVILADKDQTYRTYDSFDLENGSREDLVAYLLDSGVWPLIKQRPFNVIPDPKETPRDIFISTFDTAPLAPDASLIVEGQQEAFQKGLDVLNKLTDGTVHLSLNAKSDTPPSPIFTEAEGVEKYWFHGKHPAGNVGVQIHHINSIGNHDKVWTLGVQEVLTLGKLFTEGRFDASRTVAVVGSCVKEPKYVKTFLGAKIDDLVKDNVVEDSNVRLISGDVLSGEQKDLEGFLNIHDDQLTVIEEGDYFEMFGWLVPSVPKPSVSRTYPNFLFPDLRFKGDTNTHGEKRAFVVTGQYEAVLPMDIYPQHLMKAILIKDFERMEGLGIRELAEEDIALCEFVCTSKQPLQHILKEGLDLVRAEG